LLVVGCAKQATKKEADHYSSPIIVNDNKSPIIIVIPHWFFPFQKYTVIGCKQKNNYHSHC